MLLFRSAHRKRGGDAPEANPYPGFIPALFGEAFRIADDGSSLCRGNWTILGSAEALSAWLDACKGKPVPELPRKAKFYFGNKEFSIVADSKNIITNVN